MANHLKTLVFLASGALFFFGGYIVHSRINNPVEGKSDTIVRIVDHYKVDTLWKVLPMPLLTRTLKEVEVIRDSVGYEIEVPREQKVYEDSTYTAYVSGVKPKLDSIRVYQTTKLIERTIKETKVRHWSYGIQGGLYLTPKGILPGIGGGVTYSW